MQPFERLRSRVIPLPRTNVDTDQIIPARFLKTTHKEGLAEGLFAGWRYLPDGGDDPNFVLNRPEYRQAKFLLVGDNFGCGSSREHAPWALMSWGIRAVISSSFADIFNNNALKNGLLPVVVDPAVLERLFEALEREPLAEIGIDLATQTLVSPDGERVSFPIDAFNKTCLLQGVDTLGYLLNHLDQIEAYENSRRTLEGTR
jgi:3-isopropylmalate/(R)-2-methylmalate dehydratase small subunit